MSVVPYPGSDSEERPFMNTSDVDQRISQYIQAARDLARGRFDVEVPAADGDEIGQLGQALRNLAQSLELQYQELQKIDQITTQINAGLLLDDILENVYHSFKDIIPYNRIGFSLIENNGATVRARWATTDQPDARLKVGYEAPLAGSSLETIIQTGQPRIINDLEAYAKAKPQSESTQLILAEGIRSSLTCPLIANGIPVGFMFFSSTQPNTYDDAHVESFRRIADQLSVIVEKGRLVSDLALQKEAIEKQNGELKSLDDLKNQLLGMAAHDLRNPIGYIQMIAEFLLATGDQLPKDNRDHLLQDLYDQSRHMLDLLNDLLEVSQIESGKLEIRPRPLDLAAFLTDAVQRHGMLAAPKGTTVLLADAPPATVEADPERLRQVIDNLISNAIKYSPPGSTVRVAAVRHKGGWRVNVQDEGPGIKPNERDLLFKEFAKLSARPTGGESSTGLGLAITRRIVEAHGGRIGVDSEPGHGATFWFTLPG